ncbi:MAG: SCO family protein, partial [Blastocatellia bacterium]
MKSVSANILCRLVSGLRKNPGVGGAGLIRFCLAAGILLTGSGAAMAQLAPLPAGVQAQGLPPALKDIGIDQKLGSQLPEDLTFRDEHGQPVQLRQYFTGKPVILTLVYYDCPMLCTQILNGLTRSINVLSYDVGRDFDIITVSFNPKETSTLAAAKKEMYLKSYRRPEAVDGWHFLTGDEQNIKALTEAAGFKYAYDPASNLYAHASGIILLTPEGKISRYFYGIEYPPRDLRLGLVEASQSRIGSPIDKVLLFCYHYDPSTGKYSLLVLKIVRLAGLATVLGIGLMIIFLRRNSQKQKPPKPGVAAWPLALIPLFPEQASS